MICEVIKPLDVIVCGDLLDDGLKPGPGLGVLDVYFIPDLVVVTLRLNNLLHLLLDDLLAGISSAWATPSGIFSARPLRVTASPSSSASDCVPEKKV
mgnify:CR=1 FL=1